LIVVGLQSNHALQEERRHKIMRIMKKWKFFKKFLNIVSCASETSDKKYCAASAGF
jgi:hypothetical protein